MLIMSGVLIACIAVGVVVVRQRAAAAHTALVTVQAIPPCGIEALVARPTPRNADPPSGRWRPRRTQVSSRSIRSSGTTSLGP